MDETLYQLMDWPEIEAVVYSECQEPGNLLGPHPTDDGILIQAFIPTAESISVIKGGKKYEMEKVDEAGFFAVLIPGKKIPSYKYEVTYDNGETQVLEDPTVFLLFIQSRI